jgi:GT2 family glycosyltransferase
MERSTSSINIGIGIPTYNRFDLLESNLFLYTRDFIDTDLFIVDNGNQGIMFTPAQILTQEKNIGVGASWNLLLKKIFEKNNYALILNDDIYLGKKIHEIIALIQSKPEKFIRATPDWCAFIMPKSVYEAVGVFDECFFPAYYEDKSYEYRMKLMGISIIKSPDLNPYQYQNSMSAEKDPTLLDNRKKNKKLYIDMWGGEPEREKFKKPFGK